MPVPTPADPLGITGTTIAEKYVVGPVVGEGGFSLVYRAEHKIWQQPVALKCFKSLSQASESARDHLLDGFFQEGKLMTALSSRSAAIVQARDVGTFTTSDGTWIPYMVLEWLEGLPLDVIVMDERRAGMPPRTIFEAMALLEPAAVALQLVHSKGIAHRDIKPANIFVIGDARAPGALVKVLDFGIAKVMAEQLEDASALARTGNQITAFTPTYGAPEQFSRIHGATGPWTDVFAMALVLVELVCGMPALEGEDLLQLAVASRDPARRPTPCTLGAQLDYAIEGVFQRALAVAPGDRYATMGQFWSALHAAVHPNRAAWTGSAGMLPAPSESRPTGAVLAVPSARVHVTAGAAGDAGTVLAPHVRAESPTPLVGQTGSALTTNRVPTSPRRALGAIAVVGVLAAAGIFGYRAVQRGGADTAPSGSVAAVPAGSANVLAAARRSECPPEMVLVPGGKFFMGSDDAAFALWQPAHKVTLEAFCIDRTEVTVAAYRECSDQGECKRAATKPDYPKPEGVTDAEHEKTKAAYAELCNFGKAGREQHPINCISWPLAVGYCAFRKKRLPTEAEWEFAARGSDGRKYPWGDEPGDATRMNACGGECTRWEREHGLKPSARMYDTDDGFPGTAPVGSFVGGKTRFGALDVVGNVWEWTADSFETYKADEVVNPKALDGGDRKAIRGGGFNGGVALWLNPAFRYHQVASASAPAIGFRCAMTPP